ncbi:PAS domain-containing sensor histidine kinase [Desulfuromonas sp. AOP6]|uniref:PAS domain-containing sensor histidine kinase n=1 Tax=Desulfuromonas sp. AOP6 TaxID=1566351 RepID=UPI001286A533|nr:PAS domain-containing sensor histidine kinase [Desulfuromonas sp. AOP6]BCA80348.1 sensor histidine kinase [Desulfuromonas sp. AOP6]
MTSLSGKSHLNSCADARSGEDVLSRQARYFSDGFLARHLLEALPTVVAIVNDQRQIVYANKPLLDLVGVCDVEALRGLRPGEALRCVRVETSGQGCGDGPMCQSCGAALAVLSALAGEIDEREFRLSRQFDGRMEALDLVVRATPLTFQGEKFSVFALADVSHEKRRAFLERMFFHDILNVVGSIKGFAEHLRVCDPGQQERIFELIHLAAEQTIDEIEAQRALAAAESGELALDVETFSSLALVETLADLYRRHEVATGRELRVDPEAAALPVTSDKTLLGRVLGNMLKNALEACPAGGRVTLGCRGGKDCIEFWVHNPGVLSPEAKAGIFQRSFSTKGASRGLGTYSMELLSNYLSGTVHYTSSPEAGTCFTASYPLIVPLP